MKRLLTVKLKAKYLEYEGWEADYEKSSEELTELIDKIDTLSRLDVLDGWISILIAEHERAQVRYAMEVRCVVDKKPPTLEQLYSACAGFDLRLICFEAAQEEWEIACISAFQDWERPEGIDTMTMKDRLALLKECGWTDEHDRLAALLERKAPVELAGRDGVN